MPNLRRARSTSDLLTTILSAPELVVGVQTLPSAALAAVVRHVGIEDAGELLGLVTHDQLVDLFDSELWAGEDEEELDPERFSLWLEVLLESGASFAADRLANVPEATLLHALSGQVLVLDLDELATTMGESSDAYVDKKLSEALSHELDAYLVVSKRHDGWDAVLGLLLALDERHPDVLRPLLERLCAIGMARVEEDGLSAVLSEEEEVEEDALAEREDRRAARGYVSIADAKAFDRLPSDPTLLDRPERDAVTKAYFRRLDRSPRPKPSAPSALERVLAEAGVLRAPTPLLSARASASDADAFRRAMQRLSEEDPVLFAERLEELAFVTNVLVSLARGSGAPLRPAEAALEATIGCGRGLACVEDRGGLRRYGVDVLYRIGKHRA